MKRLIIFFSIPPVPLAILILLVISFQSQAQTYLDSDFNEVNDPINATYYQVIDSVQRIQKTYRMNDSIYELRSYSKKSILIREGKYLQYYPNGKVMYEMYYMENKLNGELKGYYENGNLRRTDQYKDDILLEGKCFTRQGADTTYVIFQKPARYHGGDLSEFNKFVMTQVKYPRLAVKKGIQGKVIVEFKVNAEGRVVDVKCVQSPHEVLCQSAIDAVNKSELWEPPMMEGKKSKQKFIIPVIFHLSE